MTALLVFAESVPTAIAEVLDRSGNAWKAASSIESITRLEPEAGWKGAIVMPESPDSVLEACRVLRSRDSAVTPIIAVLQPEWLSHFTNVSDQFDDFALRPVVAEELEARLSIAMFRAHGGSKPDLVSYGEIHLDIATYQCTVATRPLDLTYMEYELLRYFVTNPGRVFTREQLLQRVWGYEYYGGARTVDVHVRRLRAKIGEERSQLIQTVRSVGYMFGRTRI